MNPKPKCIIVTGRTGSGKTTLSKKLGERLGMPIISRDEMKEGYVNTHGIPHAQLPNNANAIVSNLFFKIVSEYLAGEISVVVEAAFQHHVWETRMPKLLELSLPIIILCTVDEILAAQRHLQRGLESTNREFYHGDPRVTHYKETGETLPPDQYNPPQFDIPTIQVSTEGEYVPNLGEIVRQIQLLSDQKAT